MWGTQSLGGVPAMGQSAVFHLYQELCFRGLCSPNSRDPTFVAGRGGGQWEGA